MYKDKEVQNVKNCFVNVWRKNIFDIYVTEYGTALTTILPILFLTLFRVVANEDLVNPGDVLAGMLSLISLFIIA
jgi:hypothetical protein